MTKANHIKASPTKGFFIHMLTKDIKLERAIIDLIDNSVDGAKRISSSKYEDLFVDIKLNQDHFTIIDNCGGFDLDTAVNYAFRFGRPDDGSYKFTENSIGRFGIGMKRALFKLGNEFVIESKTENDHFEIRVKTAEWLENPEDWSFEYTVLNHSDNLAENGTYITVTDLNIDVSNEFKSDNFVSSLKDEIEKALNFSIEKGLNIKLNSVDLEKSGLALLQSDNLSPYFKEISFNNGDIVTAKIYTGLGEPSPDNGGWYIYCNNRLVLSNDKTNLTGWEGRRFGESTVRKYHNYFAMFRGVVFFDSKDSRKLPMTTTKTGVDSNSVIYQVTRQYMIESMLQVIKFLSKVADKIVDPDLFREKLVEKSKSIDVISLKQMTFVENFIGPPIDEAESEEDEETTISYKADKALVNKVKTNLRVSSNKEVGLRTFDYFIEMEDISLDNE